MASDRAPRTLADQLRGWPDERLAALLSARPDLASPAPQDTAQLASRAATRASLLRALELLDRTELAVLEALLALGHSSLDDLAAVVNADPDNVARAVRRLTDLAVVWGTPAELRALSAAAEGLTPGQPGSTGLRPADPGVDDTGAAARLAGLSPQALALLRHVDEHGGEGTTTTGAGPVADLVARRLLVPRGPGRVVLPGNVAVALRGGRSTAEPVDVPPELATAGRDADLVDRAAAGAAFEACRHVELLLETWSIRPPPVLRTGGLGVRDLRATASLLGLDQAGAALLVEVSAVAGLLGEGRDGAGAQVWAPTDEFDRWLRRPVAEQWLRLAAAWLDSSRLVGLVGQRDRAGKAWTALAPELSGQHAAPNRRTTLETLAELPPGRVLATGTGVPSLVALVEWRRPRRPVGRAEQVAWTVEEGAALGVLALGGLSRAGAALLSDDGAAAVAALASLLPEPVDHVLLQADLTAVAPGPLTADVARRLHDVADVESRGGATVHRFTRESVRRALDGGWTAAEVHELLAETSRTPVPQALTFLVDDVARTHGSVRVGVAEAFLRSDDETALATLLHDPRAAPLGLRRLAPTVLVSSTPVDLLLPRLRELGAAPVVEAPDGTVHVTRPEAVRARAPRHRRVPAARSAREIAQVAAVVAALRAGDRAVTSRPGGGGHQTPAETLALLRDAAEAGSPVWIGYVDNHGSTTERVVDPRRVDGGRLTAFDHRSEDLRTFAVHRITAVRPLG